MAQALPQLEHGQQGEHSQRGEHGQQREQGQQLALHDGWTAALRQRASATRSSDTTLSSRGLLCAGCRAKEARYGFRDEDDQDPTVERPRTLCFSCFRVELTWRQAVKDRLARGWNAEQVSLPLEETLKELTRRRRRAQLAARHALGI